jgi:hypothetical protein
MDDPPGEEFDGEVTKLNSMKAIATFCIFVLSVVAQTSIAGTVDVGSTADGSLSETNGLYHLSSRENAPTIQLANGSSVRLGEKALIQIFKARVYSLNNGNTNFEVRLATSGRWNNPNTLFVSGPVVLRVGDHGYAFAGGDGDAGRYDEMLFKIPNEDEAKTAAQWLSVECALRSNPGYKIHTEFVPAKSEFHTNEPVLVKFVMKNLDDRTIAFQRGGRYLGSRNNEFGFRATLSDKPVAEVSDPADSKDSLGAFDFEPGKPIEEQFDEFTLRVHGRVGALEPQKAIEEQIDLKKWFAFDKAGTYAIHGFYGLDFCRHGVEDKEFLPWNVMWNDEASADFTVVVK